MKIAIAGYGIEGEANYAYWNTLDNDITIVDTKEQPDRALPPDAKTILGEGAFDELRGFDIVIRTAGLAPDKIKTDGHVWSATNEFFEKCPALIIGVTGSKGKGTTSSLIAHILRAGGHTVHLVGNIGVPALEILPDISVDDIVVYELSSFQLWDLERSPQVGVVVHIEEDHLDVHENFQDYITAKGNIARKQGINDRLIYNTKNKWASEIAELSVGQRIPYPTERTAHVRDGNFWYNEQLLCSVDELQLAGIHNQENACAAIATVWPWVQDGVVIGEGIRSFEGLEHRLKLVRKVAGIRYYDDSIATTPGSAIAALRAFSEPKIIILGGSSKGADFTELAQVAAERNVKYALLLGEEADRLETELQKAGVKTENLGPRASIEDVVEAASAHAEAGDVVILSPACASFGMFKNYADRGDQFIKAVTSLSSEI